MMRCDNDDEIFHFPFFLYVHYKKNLKAFMYVGIDQEPNQEPKADHTSVCPNKWHIFSKKILSLN